MELRYTSIIRCLLHISSISTVKYASRPFLSHVRSGKRNTFLAVCWDIVLAPTFLPLDALFFAACSICLKSKPWCRRKRASSLPMTATGMLGEMSPRRTHLCSTRGE